jgi:hypothetical protein
MKRYWYLTKKTHAPRVFTQLPNGYDIFIGEVIHRTPEGNYIHTLYDGKSDRVIKEFDDKKNCNGQCGFGSSRREIAKELFAMNRLGPMPEVLAPRKSKKTHSKIKRTIKKSGRKK